MKPRTPTRVLLLLMLLSLCYSVEDIRFIVEEARAAGLKVAAHCLTERGARNAAEGGVASIEHGLRMSDETLAVAKRNGVVLVGTDFPEKTAGYLGAGPEVARVFHTLFLDRLKRAYKVGVTMAYGTDAFFMVPGETRGALALQYLIHMPPLRSFGLFRTSRL
ncbi:MAG: amidohydrolase family protein [Acidobacteria bacterium]|nr:amidohydrolase family protein [Acidobacteriota bacterium]